MQLVILRWFGHQSGKTSSAAVVSKLVILYIYVCIIKKNLHNIALSANSSGGALADATAQNASFFYVLPKSASGSPWDSLKCMYSVS